MGWGLVVWLGGEVADVEGWIEDVSGYRSLFLVVGEFEAKCRTVLGYGMAIVIILTKGEN